MRRLAWMLLIWCCALTVAWAESSQDKSSASTSRPTQDVKASEAPARKKPRSDKPTAAKPTTGKKTSAKTVSDNKHSDKSSSAQQASPRSADTSVDSKPPQATHLNLNLPSGHGAGQVIGEEALPEQGQALPDLFAPRDGSGKVTVDGRFLVEEDLEIHPGSQGDSESQDNSKDTSKEKKSDQFKSYLDSVEGAEINIRYHID